MSKTKVLFSFEHLVTSERKVANSTQYELNGIYERYPQIINTFIKLMYFSGKLESPETEMGALQSFCHIHYTQTPYTFWTIYGLYEKGYYLEAVILYRHLLETFIQMRYFKKYPEKLRKHILNTARIRFRTMFDEFSKGYYHKFYGRQLSGAAHGDMIVKDIFRNERSTAQDARVIMGCEFNINYATYVMNNVIALMCGYLNLFETLFPFNTIAKDGIFSETIMSVKRWLESSITEHKNVHPRSLEWYKHVDKFFRLE